MSLLHTPHNKYGTFSILWTNLLIYIIATERRQQSNDKGPSGPSFTAEQFQYLQAEASHDKGPSGGMAYPEQFQYMQAQAGPAGPRGSPGTPGTPGAQGFQGNCFISFEI